jgi:hypothetical protein
MTDIVVKRPKSPSTYDEHGRYQPQPIDEITITASVQPATPKDLEDVEEGRRTRENIKLYTQTELKTASVSDARQPDVIEFDDEEYEVHSVTNWGDVGGYYKAMASKVGQ